MISTIVSCYFSSTSICSTMTKQILNFVQCFNKHTRNVATALSHLKCSIVQTCCSHLSKMICHQTLSTPRIKLMEWKRKLKTNIEPFNFQWLHFWELKTLNLNWSGARAFDVKNAFNWWGKFTLNIRLVSSFVVNDMTFNAQCMFSNLMFQCVLNPWEE